MSAGRVDDAAWTTVAEHRGVRLRSTGQGTPLFVFPGMEGSGESCLHLVLPVAGQVSARRPVAVHLVDYAHEDHSGIDALVATCTDLVTDAAGGRRSVLWGQSFGNLLAVGVAASGVSTDGLLLISPFTRLPPWKAHLGTALMRVTPRAVYRATTPPFGRLMFGPLGSERRPPFLDALRRMTPRQVGRRTSWLRSRDFSQLFERIPSPAGVWLGSADRLVDLEEQRAFFASLAERDGIDLSVIPGSGHVVLPDAAVDAARRELTDWLIAHGSEAS